MAKKTQGKPVNTTPVADRQAPVWIYSLLTDFDISLFISGKHFRLYEKMGAHPLKVDGDKGTYFAVWAPNAHDVYVTGNFNDWHKTSHRLYRRLDSSGIWEGFIPGVEKGTVYKYFIHGYDGHNYEKGDPFATRWEHPPQTASVVWDTEHDWKDQRWIKVREKLNAIDQPMSVYEVHLGSWQRDPADHTRILTYKEVATSLVPYLKEMEFTHVELMPVMEYPYYPSWGYQITGYFAASSRHGTPQELMELIEELHANDIAVILDWVPSHFPGDAHGLFKFDGTHLYEHADMRKGFHPDWKSYIFNYDRNEVRSFLISNAVYWIDQFHADGLRVDAVASMLYYDFSRKEGEAGTNIYGGRENLGAIQFLQDLNEYVYGNFQGVHTIAEESSTYPGVTRAVEEGGLGFGMKWMMGWMNDTLQYFKTDPIDRKFKHHQLTFSTTYAFTERFMLPFSHDEVVHGKSSMIYKMPGDEWRKHANLRLLYAYMFTQPGTKLLFMGNEFAQNGEWNFTRSLEWDLLQFAPHKGMQRYVKALNHLYRAEPALYHFGFSHEGFEWLSADDADHSVYVYTRKGAAAEDTLIIILNMTPVYRENYRVGLPFEAEWEEIFNSDEEIYFGSGKLNKQTFKPESFQYGERAFSIQLNIAPLAAMVLKQPDKLHKKRMAK
ncbi:1,4-alpha-glucan branching protein GlgB [Pedobacter antarcticus]|uniref:1,4-alpha-glucan branching enzyme GlgB n=1 Tax=Pedobacter antarcticus TaxID=34086 RepID=A0A1I2IB73_9SPHI|nr:1,4-alpha-glucan branching protein GlgB [Pedobacter antarcticus]SDM68887.1 1,4-alpha-glucan branching enzyme [Pedobacter antarcticus]SFF39474.1 1,4-alpha-glucan branching enzyme [Pedobacter antarcticus]